MRAVQRHLNSESNVDSGSPSVDILELVVRFSKQVNMRVFYSLV